jgi:hypothetical protein
MPILDDWSLSIDVDAVLRGQGADPTAIRSRSPSLVQAAQRAIDEAESLLSPRVLYQRLVIEELRHEQVRLRGGHRLQGPLLAQHLGGASEVVLVLCTIGEALEIYASEISKDDMIYGLSLDGLGTAGVEALANAACATFEGQAQAAGLQTSIPLSPGLLGWPVEHGQPQIYKILDPSLVDVRLSSGMLMIPRKSLTFVLGIGAHMVESTNACDYCSMKETCRYQDHYA